jgi:hypothetical protein
MHKRAHMSAPNRLGTLLGTYARVCRRVVLSALRERCIVFPRQMKIIMRGQALHACIRLDAQARAHISTFHQSTVALQRDVVVVGCTYSGEGACRDGGHSVCMQGTESMRAHVAHGLWIMHSKQVFVRHDMGPFACDRALRMQGRQLLACTGRSRCIRVHPCTVGYPCCGSSGMRVL